LVAFGLSYVFSRTYIKKAEIEADTYAVNHGLGRYIIATKSFILDHAELPQTYKNKIARLYLSPDDIVEQVRKLEEEKLEQQTSTSDSYYTNCLRSLRSSSFITLGIFMCTPSFLCSSLHR